MIPADHEFQFLIPILFMTHTITLIPGDGIGPEVTEAVVRIIAAAGVSIEWERHLAGVLAVERNGQSLPVELLESIRKNKVALKGPVTTPIAEGFTSVNVGLRKALDLYANLRPVWNLPGVPRQVLGRRPGDRSREHRGPVRRPRARGRARRRREPEDHHRARVDADRAVRVRARAAARPEESHGDPQSQHHEARRRAVSRQRPHRRRGSTPTSRTTRRSSTRPACIS